MQDVEPQAGEAPPEPFRAKPPPVPRCREARDDDEDSAHLSEATLETPEYLLFSRPGLQRRVLLDLQCGRIPATLELDLHGLTAEQARPVLRAFLADCRELRVRCARIVHGKGARSGYQVPVLKRKVNYWLRLRADVLAFCSAPRNAGGSGAVHVLLRNPDKAQRRLAG